jgi:hypothetical protein
LTSQKSCDKIHNVNLKGKKKGGLMTKKLSEEDKKKRKAERDLKKKTADKVEQFTGIQEESAGLSDLKVDLTQKEKNDFSQHLARITRELSQEELKKKEVAKNHEAIIAKLKTEIQDLATKVTDGFEFRPVKCIRRFNFKTGIKSLVRIDTGEIISETEISDHERQQKLNLDKKEKKSKKKGVKKVVSKKDK